LDELKAELDSITAFMNLPAKELSTIDQARSIVASLHAAIMQDLMHNEE
jgi:hypothetical protein